MKFSFLALLCAAFLGVHPTFSGYIKSKTGPRDNSETIFEGILHSRSYFYVGGSYIPNSNESGDSAISTRQLYVEHLVPAKVTQKYPIVMIHGNGMTGTNFLNTPDGRPGWADYFMSKGYELYIVDQPSRGRSTWQQGVDGPQSTFDTLTIEQRFTATRRFNLWPQAHLHTQWPGNGSRGDPTFDNFYVSMMPFLMSNVEASVRMHNAGVELLDKIGPAIILTHSQSGQYGWSIADARSLLVKAIVTIEPMGPPFINAVFPPLLAARPYGLTEIPVAFTPPIQSVSDISTVAVASTPNFTCIQQSAPARKLANLGKIPVLFITSESGYHTVYDECSVDFLRQAGVQVNHVALADVGIFGNGHMMFMEKNSFQIVDEVIRPWLENTF
ncbi:Alpha/Beta hydrolase protein [Flammula alnicola]|nr:Alpha/Beta hydrolase protein [Flammula alnicola]